MFFVHRRGTANALYLAALKFGISLTPIAAGEQATISGWRSSYITRTRQALIDAAVRLIAEGRGDRASIAGDHRGSRHRLRVVLQPLRQQGAAVPDRLRRGARTLGAADRPGHHRHHRPGRAVRRGHADLRAAGLDPPRHRRVPHRRRWTRWTSPAAWHRGRSATSRRGRRRAGSPCSMPRSRSARWPEACSPRPRRRATPRRRSVPPRILRAHAAVAAGAAGCRCDRRGRRGRNWRFEPRMASEDAVFRIIRRRPVARNAVARPARLG